MQRGSAMINAYVITRNDTHTIHIAADMRVYPSASYNLTVA